MRQVIPVRPPPPPLVNALKKRLQVLGNPSGEVLGKFKRNGAAHVDFNFAPQKGIGVSQLIPHAPPECVDLITKVGSVYYSNRPITVSNPL